MNMLQTVLTLTVLSVVTFAETNEVKISCDTIFCAYGQECVERRHNEPECQCVSKCYEPASPVCGSNGTHTLTYKTECELFKRACEQQGVESIVKIADVSCEEDQLEKQKRSEKIEMDASREKPMVCQEKDRDAVRHAILTWLKKSSHEEGDHRSYKGLLFSYFTKYDLNQDRTLDALEFMNIMNEDQSIKEVLSSKVSSNPMIEGLCTNALFALTDEDLDYKFTFLEFYKCLDPNFKPPKNPCTLEGRSYDDGEETEIDCNTCKCACGDWVCTSNKCKEIDNSSRFQFMKE